ncbi:hypothetical protein [Deinococcus maricopensis]|nr:hypothetical protein [Deinococcus maricopensis]
MDDRPLGRHAAASAPAPLEPTVPDASAEHAEVQAEERLIRRGFRTVVGVLGTMLGLGLLLLLLTAVVGQPTGGQVVWLLIMGALAWQIYIARLWARLVLGFLLFTRGLTGVIVNVALLQDLAVRPAGPVRSGLTLVAGLSLGLAALFMVFCVLLFAPASVRAYFAYVRRSY